MKIILVGNYPSDRQQSMQRFASILFDQYESRKIDVEMLRPEPVAARNLETHHGLGKWLGYLDKFVIFPRRLASRCRRLAGSIFIVHICDHSNAPYTRYLSRCRHLVTCNDLLAIRSSLGEFPDHPTRWTGRRLQSMILAGLNAARRVACISQATRQDLLRLTRLPGSAVDLAYMGLNYPYHPMPHEEARAVLQKLFPANDPAFFPDGGFAPSFLLHVGGNQWYKNRQGVLRIYDGLRRLQPGSPALVLAGAPPTPEMTRFISERGLADSVRTVLTPGNEELRALYSTAQCLLFPSLAEGFGWPIAEAQACGCRTITTGQAPMTEVGGATAAYLNPLEIEASATELHRLLHESAAQRSERVRQGLLNSDRFSTRQMIDNYLAIYQKLIERSS